MSNQPNWSDVVDMYHDVKLKEQRMVYMVYSDGEVVLTKGGELFGQRSAHLMAMPLLSKELARGLKFPIPSGENSYCFVPDRDAAIEVRKALVRIAEFFASRLM